MLSYFSNKSVNLSFFFQYGLDKKKCELSWLSELEAKPAAKSSGCNSCNPSPVNLFEVEHLESLDCLSVVIISYFNCLFQVIGYRIRFSYYNCSSVTALVTDYFEGFLYWLLDSLYSHFIFYEIAYLLSISFDHFGGFLFCWTLFLIS